jgi:hypothetical protein
MLKLIELRDQKELEIFKIFQDIISATEEEF